MHCIDLATKIYKGWLKFFDTSMTIVAAEIIMAIVTVLNIITVLAIIIVLAVQIVMNVLSDHQNYYCYSDRTG